MHAVLDLSYFQTTAAYNKRYTQKCNPKEKLKFALIIGKDQRLLIYGAKLSSNILVSYSTITTVGGLVTFLQQIFMYQRHSQSTPQ